MLIIEKGYRFFLGLGWEGCIGALRMGMTELFLSSAIVVSFDSDLHYYSWPFL